MTHTTDRDRALRAVRDRAGAAMDGGGAEALFAPAADAELAALLRACDPHTDLEARHAAGWLYWARCAALGEGRGGVEGSCAGMLMLPVWAADPGAVPEELAAAFAGTHATAAFTGAADGPAEWRALCAAGPIAARGRELGQRLEQSAPHPDVRPLHAFADVLLDGGAPPGELLRTAVAAGTLAVLATPAGAPERPALLSNLAAARSALGRAGRAGEGDDAPGDPADLAHRAVKAAPAHDPQRPALLGNLALALSERYENGHDPEDLDEAIATARLAVDASAPRSGRLLGILAHTLQLRLRHWGGPPAHYDEMVDLHRRAVPADPADPAGTAALHALGAALMHRAEHHSSPRDLDESVAVLTRARAAGPAGLRQRAAVANTLATALHLRHAATGSAQDLEAATALLADVEAGREDGVHGVRQRVNPALVLRARHQSLGDAGALRRAVELLREAVALLPPGHPERPAVLNDLGSVLVTRHQDTGDPAELAEAVDALRRALHDTPDGHPQRGVRLLNLGAALNLRHRSTGDFADLSESLRHRAEAADAPGTPPAERAAILAAVGGALLAGLERMEPAARAATADTAIARLRTAVALTPPRAAALHRRRHNLAVALLTRFGVTGRRRDLREARTLTAAVLAALPEGSEQRATTLTVSAAVRAAGLRALWSAAAQGEVVALLRAAADATAPGHPARARRLHLTGDALRALHDRTRDLAALRAAEELFREAALEEQSPPSERLDAARARGETAMALGRPRRALEGFTAAVDLLPSLAPRHLLRDDREFWLGRVTGLGADAAACAVHCGDPALAVRLLEQSRGVLLAQAFDADSDLTELRARDPELADRFVRLRDALDATTHADGLLEPEGPEVSESPEEGAGAVPGASPCAPPGASAPGAPTAPGPADARRRLAGEWREVTGRIRAAHPELRLFRTARDWDDADLHAAGAQGPVVLVNVSSYGSHALLVTGSAVEAVPLPALTPEAVAERQRQFHDALTAPTDARGTRQQAQAAQQRVRETLGWLWSAVTGPVLDRLNPETGAPDGRTPRLWWSPGGALGVLPLHAAGPGDGRPGALDRVVSSYTPTLRALQHARARERRARPPAARLLAVAVPEAEGLPPLPGTRAETEQLAGLLPGATVLHGASATRAEVASLLPGHAYAHFACHALSDPARPSAGRLALHGGPAEGSLTVRDLSRLRLPDARLAYLSACDTMRTSAELADESVHLVSALHMAGFSHVIGSLWHVDDAIAARLARTVYETLRTPDGALASHRTAAALHRAVCALREEYPATPSLWACQVHAGP